MTISKTLRATIKAYALERGERYRITRDGQVHVYGRMPNSVEVGWWYAGYVDRFQAL